MAFDLAQLSDLEAIKRLKYKYMRCLDQKRWDEMAECFTDDAVASYSGGKYHREGRDAIIEWLRDSMGQETFLSSHRLHHPEIELTGPDTATGVWAMEDTVIESDWRIKIEGAGFYEDEYVKVGDTWLLRRTGYRRTFEALGPFEQARLTASWWATGGQSTIEA